MTADRKPEERQWFSDKTKYAKLMEEINAKAGIVPDPTATPEKVREMMRAQGIRPEDNIFSRDIIRRRYPDELDDEEGDGMAVVQKPGEKQWFSDKTRFFKMMEEIDARSGIVADPTATVEKLREMLRARGIRPEDNLLSRDIIRARYPEDDCEG
jgi:hypothetical protein